MTQTKEMGVTVNGKDYEVHIPVDTIETIENNVVSFGIFIGYDDDDDPMVKIFVAFYESDMSDIDMVKSSLLTAQRSSVSVLMGATAKTAVRKGSVAMLKGAFRGGMVGAGISVALEVGKYVYAARNSTKDPVGYVSEDGDILDKMWALS